MKLVVVAAYSIYQPIRTRSNNVQPALKAGKRVKGRENVREMLSAGTRVTGGIREKT